MAGILSDAWEGLKDYADKSTAFLSGPSDVPAGYNSGQIHEYASIDGISSPMKREQTGDRYDQIPNDLRPSNTKPTNPSEPPKEPTKEVPHKIAPDNVKDIDKLKDNTKKVVQKNQQETKDADSANNYPNPVSNPELESVTSSHGGQVEREAPAEEILGMSDYTSVDEMRNKYNTEQGRYNADFQGTNEEWWEDQSFYQGLMRWGLGVMGGEGYGAAFDAASKVYETNKAQDQRQKWAEEMTDEYDPRSIQKWIETGNEDDLHSYEDMASEQDERILKREAMMSRVTPEEALKNRQLDRQTKQSQLRNLNSTYEWDKESRQYKIRDYNDKHNTALATQNKLQAQTDKAKNGGSGTKQTELMAKSGLYSQMMTMGEDPSLNYIPGGFEDLGTMVGEALTPDSPAGQRTARKFTTDAAATASRKKRDYVQGMLRMASGSAYGALEMGDWESILLPQTNDPKEVHQKALTRQVVTQQLDKMSRGEPGLPLDVVKGLSNGTYVNINSVNGVTTVQKPDGSWWAI